VHFFYLRLTGSDLVVNVSDRISCKLGQKSRQIVVETVPNVSAASFRKDPHGFIYSWPTAWDNAPLSTSSSFNAGKPLGSNNNGFSTSSFNNSVNGHQ
jgi:hypothetical protein